MASPKPKPPKAPIPGLIEASQRWHSFAREMDESLMAPDQVAVAHFQALNLKLQQGVDEAISFLNSFPAEQHMLAGYIAWAQDRIAKLQQGLEACEKKALAEVEANPDHIYKGTLGKLASHKKGGGGEISITGLDIDYRNKLKDPKQAFDLDVPAKFLKREVIVRLDRAGVKDAIAKGEKFTWADVKKGTKLSYPKWKPVSETVDVEGEEPKILEAGDGGGE